jgi:signal transduction histidine kinase
VRDQFIATVSHELRTPLTSVRGWLDLLIEDSAGFEPSQLESIERVDRNVDRLARLVEDLLDLTLSDAGVLNLRRERVDLAELTREAVAAMARRDPPAQLDVSVSVPASVMVIGDTHRLAQVIDNLCSNAAKYTPAGGRVDIELAERAGCAVLRVTDSGVGIPAAERIHLFERFFRASTATDNEIPGAGLGLAISKAIVEHHGGTMDVEDGHDGGIAVTVTLPLGDD